MNLKTKTSDLIYNQMVMTTPQRVAHTAVRVVDAVQGQNVPDQLLGMAAAFICMLDQYGLESGEVLGQAHNYVYDGNIRPEFKAIKNYMQSEWNI